MTDYAKTARSTLHRRPARGHYDRQTVHAILDEALVCQIGWVVEGQPLVMPTAFVREGERLWFHGASANRMLQSLAGGMPACLSVTLLDGLVLARSAFHHSVNYRSVVVFGVARETTDLVEKRSAMARLVDKVSPGRSSRCRAPTDKELAATSLLWLPLEEVSAKVRQGSPIDDAEDSAFPVWSGVVPLKLQAHTPRPDGADAARFDVPALPDAFAPAAIGPRSF